MPEIAEIGPLRKLGIQLEVSTGESMGGMGYVTDICTFDKNGQRIIWWTWAHHIDGPMDAAVLADAVKKVVLDVWTNARNS